MYVAATLTAIGFCFFRAGIGRGPQSSETPSVQEENENGGQGYAKSVG
jgi:hypothetical protein